MTATGGTGIDVVLDCVGGGSYTAQNAAVLAVDGTWILFGLLGGPRPDDDAASMTPPLLATILRKRIHLKGTTLRPRSIPYKEELVRRFLAGEGEKEKGKDRDISREIEKKKNE